jgi:C-terminal processing protease CtpA/Prc
MKFAAYLLAGIGLGFAVAYWQIGSEPVADWESDFAFDDGAPVEQRLSELETALALERFERRALAEEFAALQATLAEQADDGDAEVAAAQNPRQRIAALLESDEDNPVLERVRERFANGGPGQGGFDEAAREQRQLNRFIEAGLTPDRAQYIVQREDEIAMEVLQARYDATQDGATTEEVANLNSGSILRAELGDADYEKYLAGSGRPTTINVREVLTNSPAQAAGLQPGDQIVGYDGKRVFDMSELTDLTYEGRPGDTVPINVIRDGQEIQLYVERGPIGVSGGGRSTRRR